MTCFEHVQASLDCCKTVLRVLCWSSNLLCMTVEYIYIYISGLRLSKSVVLKVTIILVMSFILTLFLAIQHTLMYQYATLQPAYITKSATVAGTAAMAGEEEKELRHDNEVTAAGGNFYPLVVESYGYWTPSSLESLKTIAAKTTSRNRTTFSQAFNNLMQQLSVRIWQYNARMINARINLDVDFDFWDLPTMGEVG